MGLKKDYPSEDPASTPTDAQDQTETPDPPAKWLPIEDTPLGAEGSQFFGCRLGVEPYRPDHGLALEANEIGPTPERTTWRVIDPSGREHTGVAADRVSARIAAEDRAAAINCAQIDRVLRAADKYSRDHDLCVHCRSDLDGDGKCTGCGMGQEVDGSTRADPCLCANCDGDTQKIGTSAAGGAGIRWCPECGTIECQGVFQVPAEAQL